MGSNVRGLSVDVAFSSELLYRCYRLPIVCSGELNKLEWIFHLILTVFCAFNWPFQVDIGVRSVDRLFEVDFVVEFASKYGSTADITVNGDFAFLGNWKFLMRVEFTSSFKHPAKQLSSVTE